MKYIKLFEDWVFENEISHISEWEIVKESDDLENAKIKNPKSGRMIKLASALKYDKGTELRKAADEMLAKLKKKPAENDADAEKKLQKDISDEIEKRGKQYKEEAKEYGEEWTKEDDRNLRNEVLLDFYGQVKDPKAKRKIEDEILDSEDIKTSDYAKVARTFDNEGVDRAIEKLGKEKIDALLDGNGQELGELILRSKNATPEQRQKAIMFQWVQDSASPGAILAAEHLTKKIGMGKKAQDGLAYRQENGSSFDSREYGGLRDDVKKENIKAVDDIYNKTQEHFKKKGIKDIEVYRGSDEKDPDKYENPIESWTTDPEVGKNYGEYTHKKKVPVERIFTGHFDKGFPDPYAFGATDKDGNPIMSKEIVVLGGK
jgi:hypothetical protein